MVPARQLRPRRERLPRPPRRQRLPRPRRPQALRRRLSGARHTGRDRSGPIERQVNV